MTPIMLIFSAVLTTICVRKLVQVGLIFNIYSYSLIMERVFGHKSRIILDFMIATTQFSFTISQITFIIRSLQSSIPLSQGY